MVLNLLADPSLQHHLAAEAEPISWIIGSPSRFAAKLTRPTHEVAPPSLLPGCCTRTARFWRVSKPIRLPPLASSSYPGSPLPDSWDCSSWHGLVTSAFWQVVDDPAPVCYSWIPEADVRIAWEPWCQCDLNQQSLLLLAAARNEHRLFRLSYSHASFGASYLRFATMQLSLLLRRPLMNRCQLLSCSSPQSAVWLGPRRRKWGTPGSSGWPLISESPSLVYQTCQAPPVSH